MWQCSSFFFCLLENRSFQLVLKCHMWQVLKAVTMIQELPASLTDDRLDMGKALFRDPPGARAA